MSLFRWWAYLRRLTAVYIIRRNQNTESDIMSKSEKLGAVNLETGEFYEDGFNIFKSIELEEIKSKYREIYNKLQNNPLDLNTEELEILKKKKGDRESHSVNLKYEKGFYMTSCSEEDLFSKLDVMTVYILHMCAYRMNKEGVLKYKNGRPIKSFKDLREFFNLSYHKWRPIEKDINDFKLIKEQDHDNEKVLVINPLYKSSDYRITFYKFMAFHNELKEYLHPIDYLYLCKKFEIVL